MTTTTTEPTIPITEKTIKEIFNESIDKIDPVELKNIHYRKNPIKSYYLITKNKAGWTASPADRSIKKIGELGDYAMALMAERYELSGRQNNYPRTAFVLFETIDLENLENTLKDYTKNLEIDDIDQIMVYIAPTHTEKMKTFVYPTIIIIELLKFTILKNSIDTNILIYSVKNTGIGFGERSFQDFPPIKENKTLIQNLIEKICKKLINKTPIIKNKELIKLEDFLNDPTDIEKKLSYLLSVMDIHSRNKGNLLFIKSQYKTELPINVGTKNFEENPNSITLLKSMSISVITKTEVTPNQLKYPPAIGHINITKLQNIAKSFSSVKSIYNKKENNQDLKIEKFFSISLNDFNDSDSLSDN